MRYTVTIETHSGLEPHVFRSFEQYQEWAMSTEHGRIVHRAVAGAISETTGKPILPEVDHRTVQTK